MELLLNLFWLLLVMPAFWLWRYSRTAPEKRKSGPFHTFLALGCLLVVLFPVISATDDMRAMGAEMEESPSGKTRIGNSSGDKSWASRSVAQPAFVVAFQPPFMPDAAPYEVPKALISTAASAHVIRAPRAPPRLLLA